MADIVERLKKALADRYAIERELGRGGMAAVYLAEDLKHGRKVAVKVLHPELAATLGPDRFLREIGIAARLTHPHILPLLDSGEASGFVYYVMPYIEGQSLRGRLVKEHELPVGEVVRILRDVVDALAEAHEHGVVHRDIKPDNVLIRGHHALVTDFGVAKAVSEATGRQALTTAGIALGTPAYMAPEQAAADPNVDHRADIYAVGVMAYEMLTGKTPFEGTAPAILAAHVTEVPTPVSTHRAAVPVGLAMLVMRCLEKKPADRWQSALELTIQLETLLTPSGGSTPTDTRPVTAVGRSRSRQRMLLSLTGGAVAVAALLVMLVGNGRGSITLGRRQDVTNVPGLEIDPAVSPDGKFVAYVAGPVGLMQVYTRQVGGGQPIGLTTGVPGNHRVPQWSPDGARILFLTFGSERAGINIVSAFGGAPRQILSGTIPAAAWSPDGRSVAFVENGVLYRRDIDGQDNKEIAKVPPETYDLAWSPNGDWIAFAHDNATFQFGVPSSFGNIAPCSIWLVSTRTGSIVRLTDGDALNLSPTWTSDSRGLLFVSDRDGGRDVYYVAISRSGRAASPTRLTTGINAHTVHLSADGRVLTYSSYTHRANIWAMPMPGGHEVSISTAAPVTSENAVIEAIDLSRDGQWLAFDSDRGGAFDIYSMPSTGGQPRQLTAHPAGDFEPQWTANGKRIVFQSWRSGTRGIYMMNSDGQNVETVADLPRHENYPTPSPSGDSIVFQDEPPTGPDLGIAGRSTANGAWKRLGEIVAGAAGIPHWSPDGRFIAFGQEGAIKLVSAAGGPPRAIVGVSGPANVAGWSPDSRNLFYMQRDSARRERLWSIPISGGSPRAVVRFDDPLRQVTRGFATDGRRLFLTIVERESDIWTVEVKQ